MPMFRTICGNQHIDRKPQRNHMAYLHYVISAVLDGSAEVGSRRPPSTPRFTAAEWAICSFAKIVRKPEMNNAADRCEAAAQKGHQHAQPDQSPSHFGSN